jgi:hypothetical protein
MCHHGGFASLATPPCFQALCESLLKNYVSTTASVVSLSLKIFLALIRNFRVRMHVASTCCPCVPSVACLDDGLAMPVNPMPRPLSSFAQQHLKQEIEVFIANIFLRLLLSTHIGYDQKVGLVASFMLRLQLDVCVHPVSAQCSVCDRFAPMVPI